MKAFFYHLQAPLSQQYHVYGRPAWGRRFGLAEWSDRVLFLDVGRLYGLLPPGHPKAGRPRADLTIIMPSANVGDFVWTWYSDCVVTDSTLSLFKAAGLSGFQARPVVVEKVKGLTGKRKAEVVIPTLWELAIVGKGGDAASESGIHVIDRVEESGAVLYSSFRNGIIVDEANWDGSDFFTVNGYPKYILVSERVKDFIISHQLTNCALIPSHELEWKSGTRPEESLEERRTMARRDLASLLADLEAPDTSKVLKTVDALGDKKDPQALDALIRAFTHPDGIIRDAAASAVASIGGHRQTSEQVRMETFSRLRSLLSHENPVIRRISATALGRMGGDRTGEEMIKLLQDPEDSVRQTAVFQIGQLAYKPALNAVKGLTRDSSPLVRKTARRVLRELRAESS
jgi:hypothetical protein